MTGVLTSGGNELADRLSASVRATVLPVITEAELDGVRQYQAEDRFYEVVNGVLRGDLSLGALDVDLGSRVVATVRAMDLLLERWRLPEPVQTYRGVRNLALTFGATPRFGERRVLAGYMSSSLHRPVALDQFTRPTTAVAALLTLDVPAGVPAIWVPPLGAPALADQAELVLGPSITLVVHELDDRSGTLELTCEVIP